MKKILLIEDNPDVRESTVDILELANYEVITADNGRSGIEQALACKPDLIVCDIMMPVLDGYGVLHILSKNPETAGIPLVFLTAKSEKADMRKGMNLGADDYLTKPFEGMELLDAVESRLQKSDLLKKEFTRNADGLDTFLHEASRFRELHDLSKKKVRMYKKKTNIFLEGSWANVLYYINRGQVKTYKTNSDGKEFVTGIWGPGEFIGYMPLLGKKDTYSETATALGEVEVRTIPREDFLKLLYNNRDVAGKFIKILSNNLMDREQQLLQIAYHSIRQRVAEALLKLDSQNSKGESIGFSREDLAGMIGTVKETVIRTLSDFREEGLIKIEKKEITILDKDKLMRATH